MLQLSELFNSSRFIGTGSGIFLSPVRTAAITVGIVLLIVYFTLRNEVEPVYDDTSLLTLLLRIGVWVFLVDAVILYLSYGAIQQLEADKHKNKNKEQIVLGVMNTSAGEGSISPA